MATTLQLRRGNTAAASAFTGSSGEVFIDTTKNTALIHDGSTQGGHELALAADLSTKLGAEGGTITSTTDSTTVSTGALIIDGGLGVAKNITASTMKSTVATGTAPLTVASTTAVTNLNADLLDGNHASAFSPVAGSSSITTVGTVATGTWSATEIGVAHGGTGSTSLTSNAVLLGNGTSAVQTVAPGTSGNVLVSNGTTWTSGAANYAPTAGSTSITCLGTISAGTWNGTAIDVAHGGTGSTSLTSGSVVVGNGTSAVSLVAPGTSGNLLTSTGTGWSSTAPSFAPTAGSTSITCLGTISAGTWNGTTIDVAHGGTGATTLTAGSLVAGNGTSAVNLIAPGTAGNVLTSTGTGWVSCAAAGGGGVSLDATCSFKIGDGLASLTTGVNNFAIGCNAVKAVTIGTDNVGMGTNALTALTTGKCNIAVGTGSLKTNIVGCNNIAIGVGSQCNSTASGLVSVGVCSLYANTTGQFNTAIGDSTMVCNTIGQLNVAVGSCAMYGNTTGVCSTAVGSMALRANTTGTRNIAVGSCALYSATAAYDSIAIGAGALAQNTTGNNNIAIGRETMQNAGAFKCNIAIGTYALYSTSTGCMNVAIGHNALSPNSEIDNVSVGYNASCKSSSGTRNTAMGSCAAYNATSGFDNVSVGYGASGSLCVGCNNVAIGACAGGGNSYGCFNIAIGKAAGQNSYCANHNTTIGTNAGNGICGAGSSNIVIGSCTPGNGYGCCAIIIGNSIGQMYGGSNFICMKAGSVTLDVGSSGLYVNGSAVGGAMISGYNSVPKYSFTVNSESGCSLGCVTSGAENLTAIGSQALAGVTTGKDTVAIGCYAGFGMSNGHDNFVAGPWAAYQLGSSTDTIAIGASAGRNSQCGSGNIALGNSALYSNTGVCSLTLTSGGSGFTEGTYTNVPMASNNGCLSHIADPTVDVVVDSSGSITSMTLTSPGSGIVAPQSQYGTPGMCIVASCIGGGKGVTQPTFTYDKKSGNNNIALGNQSLLGNSIGDNNIAMGVSSGKYNVVGNNNIAIGSETLLSNTIGCNNVAVGSYALRTTLVDTLVASIKNAGASYSDGTYSSMNLYSNYSPTGVLADVVISGGSIQSVTYVSGNLPALGVSYMLDYNYAGYGNYSASFGFVGPTGDSSSNNTAIGYSAGCTNSTGCNNVFLGYDAQGASATASNVITLGNSSITTLRAQVTSITALSDARDKTNVQDIPVGLEFVNALRPVKFEWNTRDGAKVGIEDAGFIAQEVAEVEDNFQAADWMKLVYKENPEKLELSAGKLIPVLVKAIQQLSARVEELENK